MTAKPVAVVTGGARGIGLAIGRWFLAHGHKVVLLDVDLPGYSGEEVLQRLRQKPPSRSPVGSSRL